MSFVNSIITDKVKYTSSNQDKSIQKQSQGGLTSLVPKDSQNSDLALV